MKLSPEQKAANARERQIHECMKSKPKYQAKVAVVFQRMIRAEDALKTYSKVCVSGRAIGMSKRVGTCACITCCIVLPWTGPKESIPQMQTGHFLAGRKACILFEEDNVAPQCSTCNKHNSGMPLEFRKWMEAVRGLEAIERLERLKRESVSINRETLVDMWIEFSKRLKAAEAKMNLEDST